MFNLNARVEPTIYVPGGVDRPWWKRHWTIVAGATVSAVLALGLIPLLISHQSEPGNGPGHLVPVVERTNPSDASVVPGTEVRPTTTGRSQPSPSARPLTRAPKSAQRPPAVGSFGQLYEVTSV